MNKFLRLVLIVISGIVITYVVSYAVYFIANGFPSDNIETNVKELSAYVETNKAFLEDLITLTDRLKSHYGDEQKILISAYARKGQIDFQVYEEPYGFIFQKDSSGFVTSDLWSLFRSHGIVSIEIMKHFSVIRFIDNPGWKSEVYLIYSDAGNLIDEVNKNYFNQAFNTELINWTHPIDKNWIIASFH